MLHGVVHFMKAECVECALLHLRSVDAALDLFDFQFCHLRSDYLPLNTFSTLMPRLRATCRGERISSNAAMVAFTRL